MSPCTVAQTMNNDATSEAENAPKKTRPYRLRPGTKALREVRKLQKTTHNVIPRVPFERLVRELLDDANGTARIRKQALRALQEAAESYVTDVLRQGNTYAIHAKRTTLCTADLDFAKQHTGEEV